MTNRELRDRLSALNREIGGFPEGKDPFYGAPAVLIVLADKSCPTGIYDGSLVMGNLMLAAHALGLGSIWIHRAKEEFERPEYKQLLKDLGVEGEWEGIVPSTAKPRSPHPAGTAGCSGLNKQNTKKERHTRRCAVPFCA